MASAPPFILYENTLGSILRGLKAEQLDPSLNEIPIAFSASAPTEVRDWIRKRAVLNNQIQLDLASAIRTVVGARIAPQITAASTATPALRNQVNRALGEAAPTLQGRVISLVRADMKSSSEWKAYKWDSQKEVARISLTLTLSVVAAGISPPTAGASIGLLIVSLARGMTDASKKFAETYRTAEESEARVIKEVARLRASYGKSETRGRASNLGGAFVHALGFGKAATVFGSDPMPGFTRIKTELSAYKGKLGHLRDYSEKLARRLYEMLEKIDDYQRAHGIDPGDADRLPPKLREQQARIAQMLSGGVSAKSHGFRGKITISGVWERSQRGLERLPQVDRAFKDLQDCDDHMQAVRIADRIITLLTNLGVSLAGYNASMKLDHPSSSQIVDTLEGNKGHAIGGSTIGMSLSRQIMSLFKDSNALRKDLGLIGASTPESEDLFQNVRGEFANVAPVAAQAPRLPDLDLPAALDIQWEGATPRVPARQG